VFLPYGPVSSLTTFTYIDADGDSNNVSSSDYTIRIGTPTRLWAADWSLVLPQISQKSGDLPVTITYTPGYTSFAEIPRSTLQALKILCYHEFVNRGEEDKPIPQAYCHHVSQAMINSHRACEFLT